MAKINARAKGNTYEREVAAKFRAAGFSRCVTSRSESKRLDDLGVDLCYTDPWIVQCKAVERLGPVHDIINGMPPPGIPLVFHKRNRKGTVVSMRESDFWKILRALHAAGDEETTFFPLLDSTPAVSKAVKIDTNEEGTDQR